MAMELLREIKEAEAKAEELTAEANNTARRMLKDASERSYAIQSETEEKAAEEAKAVVQAGVASADEEVRRILQEADREIAMLRARAQEAEPKAVKLIRMRLTD